MFDPNAVFDAVLIRIKVVIDFLRLKLTRRIADGESNDQSEYH
jgi:hypothetical protein